VGLVSAAPAAAIECKAPPGTAAVDEYCESIPAATGDRGHGTQGAPPWRLPGRTMRQLQAAGRDGEALGRFLGEQPGGGRPGRDRPVDGSEPSTPSSNPLASVRAALSGTDTIGAAFPGVLLAITLMMSAVAWSRVRRRS
jgi:hypothetical protein